MARMTESLKTYEKEPTPMTEQKKMRILNKTMDKFIEQFYTEESEATFFKKQQYCCTPTELETIKRIADELMVTECVPDMNLSDIYTAIILYYYSVSYYGGNTRTFDIPTILRDIVQTDEDNLIRRSERIQHLVLCFSRNDIELDERHPCNRTYSNIRKYVLQLPPLAVAAEGASAEIGEAYAPEQGAWDRGIMIGEQKKIIEGYKRRRQSEGGKRKNKKRTKKNNRRSKSY